MKKFTLTMPGVWLMALLSLFFFTACSESDTDGDTDDKPDTETSTGSDGTGAGTGSGGGTSPLYLVSRIDVEYKQLDTNGDIIDNYDESILYFEYDDNGRVTSIYTDENGDGTVNMLSYEYDDDKIVVVYETNVETEYRVEATYTLGEDGYVTSFISEQSGTFGSYTTTGTLTYSDGYVVEGIRLEAEDTWEETCVDTAVWDNGNLVEVSHSYIFEESLPSLSDMFNEVSVGKATEVSEMSYDNPDYVNNTDINLDLNYLVASTVVVDMMFGNGNTYPALFGYMGKRSALYMTKEYNRSTGVYYTYTYQFDELGRPITVVSTETYTKPAYTIENTYKITYQ